ncbi:MAG: hypothetical protein ACKOB6_05150, partial [Candidatus Kapaibacterium sp.]
NSTHVVLVIPSSEREKSVEVFVLRSGFLKMQCIVGRKASLDPLCDGLRSVYLESGSLSVPPSLHEIEELRILAQWMYRRRSDATIIAADAAEVASGFTGVIRAVRSAWDESGGEASATSDAGSAARGISGIFADRTTADRTVQEPTYLSA